MATRRLFLAARVAERDARRLAGRRRGRGGRRPDRVGRTRRRRCRPTPPRRHEVHDLGDVSLLPGLRRDPHPHALPVAARLPRDRPARAGRADRSSGPRRHMRGLLLSGATTARDTGSRDDVALAIRSAIRDGVMPSGRACSSSGRRSPRPPATTGSSAPRPTRPTRSSRGCASARSSMSTRSRSMASGGGYTPTSNPRSQQYGARDAAGPPSTRRTGWGCRSWPTR